MAAGATADPAPGTGDGWDPSVDGGGTRRIRPRGAGRGPPGAAAGADLGSDAEHGVAGVRGRTGRRDARRDGRRCHQRHHRSPADCHLDRDRLLGFDAGLRIRHQSGHVRRVAFPGRPRARRGAPDGDRHGERVRSRRARGHGDDDADDGLPRRCGRHRPARHPADPAVRLGVDVRRRCAAGPGPGAAVVALPARVGGLPARPGRARRPGAQPPEERARTRSASCSGTASPGPRSPSGSPRSWACCWSTA